MAVLKTIQDYYEKLYEEYPTIPKEDIRRICLYGIKSLNIHNNYGGDVLISRKGFWFYCGQLMNNSLHYFNYYKKKIRVKLRIMYKRKNIPWDAPAGPSPQTIRPAACYTAVYGWALSEN